MRSLQSLLCSSLADYKDTVLAYLDPNLLFRVLCQLPSRDTVRLLASQCPGAVSYCKHERVTNTVLWTLALGGADVMTE